MTSAVRASSSASSSLIEKRIRSLRRHVDGGYGLARAAIGGEDHLDRLVTDGLAQHRRPALDHVALVDVELVRIDRALDDRFAQAVSRSDEHDLVESGFGIEREHHARRPLIAADHALHAGRQRDFMVGKVLVHPVGDRAIVVERREYLLYRVKNIVQAIDI